MGYSGEEKPIVREVKMWLTDDPSELIYHRLVKRDAPGMLTVDLDIWW